MPARLRSWLAGSRWDLLFSLRSLARQPGFTLVAILTLALGIGATAAIWSAVHAVLLAGLPYPHADRLVLVEGALHEGNNPVEKVPVSYRDFYDWDEQSHVFAGLQAYSDPLSFNLVTGDRPEHVQGEMVSGGYFALLGARPVRGRALTADDDSPGAPPVVVVSQGLSQRYAPRGGSLLGATLRLNGRPFAVVGIMAAGFRGLTDRAELWLPLAATSGMLGDRYLIGRGRRWLNAVGALAPHASVRAAQREMDAITAGLSRQYKIDEGIGARVVPLAQAWFGDLRLGLLLLLAGAGCVLLLACTNVAGLLLARAAARQREISIRTVLGAHRTALVRQLLVESVLLAVAGCALGLLLAHWGIRLLVAQSAIDLRSFVRLGVNLPVVGAILAVSMLCSLAFGLAPAWLGSSPDLRGALQDASKGTAGRGRHRFLAGIVVVEVALAIVVLVGAGMLLQGFLRLGRTDLGFRADGLLTVRLALKGERYAAPGAPQRLAQQLAERLGRLPGIAGASLESPDIPTDDWTAYAFYLENRLDAPPLTETYLVVHSVSPGYFRTLGIPLAAGRDFAPSDDLRATAVAILSQTAAARYWPGKDALGKRFRFADVGTHWYTVVGVAKDVKHGGLELGERPGPDAYFSLFQTPPHNITALNVLLRPAQAAPSAVVAGLRRELRELAPDLPLYDMASIEERLARQTARDRFLTLVLGLFATLALVLAAVGTYGVISYTVAQRRGEIGIRMALGARRRDVFRQMLRRGVLLAAAGLALGVLAALAVAPFLARYAHGAAAANPLTLLGASLLLGLVVLAANCIPSWRASRIEPSRTLRID